MSLRKESDHSRIQSYLTESTGKIFDISWNRIADESEEYESSKCVLDNICPGCVSGNAQTELFDIVMKNKSQSLKYSQIKAKYFSL